MSSNKGKKAGRASSPAHVTRHRRKNFTEDVYGARLPFEDARIIDDYGKANNLDRSQVVRLGLHQFALRQQMRYHKKDPLRETIEQVVAERIAPVHRRTDETLAMLRDLAGFIFETQQNSSAGLMTNDNAVSPSLEKGSIVSLIAQIFAEHKQILEHTLMIVILGLRIQIDYLVDPVLTAAEASAGGELENHL